MIPEIENCLNEFTVEKVPSSNHGKPRVTGAYAIIHKDGVYIGSTSDLYRRAIDHKSLLTRNCHPNKRLQEAYNGDSIYKFNVYITKNREEAYDIEQGILDSYFGKVLFNISPTAKQTTGLKPPISDETRRKMSASSPRINLGKVFSEETRRKISLANKGRKVTEAFIEKQRSVSPRRIPVTIEGNDYRSFREAERVLNIDHFIIRKRVNSDLEKFKEWKYLKR